MKLQQITVMSYGTYEIASLISIMMPANCSEECFLQEKLTSKRTWMEASPTLAKLLDLLPKHNHIH